MIKLLITSIAVILIIFFQNGINDDSIAQVYSEMELYQEKATEANNKVLDILTIDNEKDLKEALKNYDYIVIDEELDEEKQIALDIIEKINIKTFADIDNNKEEIMEYLYSKYDVGDLESWFVEDPNYTYNEYYVLDSNKLQEYYEELEASNNWE